MWLVLAALLIALALVRTAEGVGGSDSLPSNEEPKPELQVPNKVQYTVRVHGLGSDGPAPAPPVPIETTVPVATAVALTIPDLICSYSWPCQEALAVAWCESTHNPAETGAAGEWGLFQIHPVHWRRFDGRDPYDPATNVEVAHAIWSDQGWGPWTCKPY